MVHSWSNIGNLETEIANIVSGYMLEEGLTQEETFAVPDHKEELLSRISDTLIYTMRTTATTGVFAFFADEEDFSSDKANLTGLYYRDFNPIMNSADYSDIQIEKGPAGIAQKYGISLSSLWSEIYTIKAEHAPTWEAFSAPYQAAIKNPTLATSDLALWSDAHFLEPDSKNDSNPCIAYTRPLFFEEQLIGIIGVEIQIENLIKYFPSGDIGEKGGYALFSYRADGGETSDFKYAVNAATGSYIKRLADFGITLELKYSGEGNIYHALSGSFEPSTVAIQTIKLYNSNAPFSDRQWALAAVQPDSVLFENSAKIRSGILTSSAISLVLGFIFILISIRMATKPLLSIATQIEHGGADELVVVKNTKTYEINLLCDTINEMKRKRQDVEIALREEGERYLLALESAIDVFIEYDALKDRLKIYFFAEEGKNQELTSWTLENFRANVGINAICHPSDVRSFGAILFGEQSEPCEMRLQADRFPHITDTPSDNGYYWFSFTAVPIRSDGEKLEKTIGSAKQITREKLVEFAGIEASRRDLTTGAYNREYGRLIIEEQTGAVEKSSENNCLLAIVIGNFEKIEAYYGRMFGAAILREISNRILNILSSAGSLIRWSNAEFVAFCAESEVESLVENLRQIHAGLYTGENKEIVIAINLGICKDHGGAQESLKRALAAAYSCGSIGVNFMYADEQTRVSRISSFSQSDLYSENGIEISTETTIGVALSLFEQAVDVSSVMNMLLRILGGLFSLHRIMVCEYDEDFGTNRIAYQWTADNTSKYPGDIERIQHADFIEFASSLDERGMMIYSAELARDFSDGMRQLLCIGDEAEFIGMCCEMYENGLHTGRAIFVSLDETNAPAERDILDLYEVAKIISTRLNLEKSNSANRAKSEFLSKMSHEIRTPMNAIIGLTRMAKDSLQDTEQVKNSLDKIDLSAKHLLSLINDILDMSRIESGKLTIAKQPFLLTNLVSSIDTLMRPQFEDKGVDFILKPSISHAAILGDEQKLCQVIINLLSNACKFTPSGGRVELVISQQLEDGELCECFFSVKDNGVGIDKKDQLHIFDAFEQSNVSNLEAGNPRGTGLGLAISNSFVAAMGSRIELKSDSGQGSEFYFTLKLECSDDDSGITALREGSDPRAAEPFKGKRALLVDDNEINLEIAAYLIEDIGFICDIARDGKEAVEKFLASEPGYYSIIFMDISMPVMDGFAATREIRKRFERSDSRNIPIIAMTANAFSEDTKKSIEAGMNAHVAKPIDVDFLYATLEKLFSVDSSAENGEGA